MVIDGEEDMIGDEADYWIMYKAQRQRACVNVYFKGQSIWIGGRKQTDAGELDAAPGMRAGAGSSNLPSRLTG